MDTLDNILSDEPIADVEVQETEQIETPEAKAERDEKGRFAPKGETESASPAPVEEPPFDHAAVKGERERRQKAEARIKELEEQLQAPQEPAAPPVSMWEDETAWQQQFGSQVIDQATQRASFNANLNMSEMLTRRDHKEDFDEMKEVFLNLAKENPVVYQQAVADPDPWAKAYQIAKNHKAMQELGAVDVESMRAKIREEVLAETAPAAPAINLPRSLADSQSSRPGSVAAFRPPTLEEILGQ